MKRIITFGEIMMRLNPEGYLRFVQADKFEATYAGGEANVAVSLANYGMDAAFVTKLPAHEIGQCVINELRRFGVDTRSIVRGGERLGLYFVEKGASQRASKVIYDRAGSAIAKAVPRTSTGPRFLRAPTGSTSPALPPLWAVRSPRSAWRPASRPRPQGLRVSCDLNYRKKLWSREEAGRVMAGLMPYVDVCIANEEDAKDVFGIAAENTDLNAGKVDQQGYISVARQLTERFGFKKVAITLRGSISASDNDWAGMLYSDGKACFSPTYRVHIVDRVGGGDSFGGGLIYALLSDYDDQKAINFAVAASCLKHSLEHDFNLVSVAEVESLAGGNASGRVQR